MVVANQQLTDLQTLRETMTLYKNDIMLILVLYGNVFCYVCFTKKGKFTKWFHPISFKGKGVCVCVIHSLTHSLLVGDPAAAPACDGVLDGGQVSLHLGELLRLLRRIALGGVGRSQLNRHLVVGNFPRRLPPPLGTVARE